MKQRFSLFLVFALILSLLSAVPVYAVGEGNLDGGGGSMGQGTSLNSGRREMKVCG